MPVQGTPFTGTYGDIQHPTSGTKIGQISYWSVDDSVVSRPFVNNMTNGATGRASGSQDLVGSFRYDLDKGYTKRFKRGDRITVKLFPDINSLNDFIQVPILIERETTENDIGGDGIVGGLVTFGQTGAPTYSGAFVALAFS